MEPVIAPVQRDGPLIAHQRVLDPTAVLVLLDALGAAPRASPRRMCAATPDESGLRAADVLGPDGASVEAGLFVPATEVPAFFASVTTIERIDVTGPGVPAFGGFAFPVSETLNDGSVNEYEVIVTTDAGGALRLVWLMPGQLKWLTPNV